MMSIGDSSVETKRSQAGTPVELVTEELWQKGYDLQRAGAGWIIKEPLGRRNITFASDAELLEYAADRVTTTIPHPEIKGQKHSVPPVAAEEQPVSISKTEYLKKAWPAWLKHRAYVVIGIVGLCTLLSVWITATTHGKPLPGSETLPESGQDVLPRVVETRAGDSTQSTSQITLPTIQDDNRTGKPELATTEKVEQPVIQSKQDGKDLSEPSNRCISRLREKYATKDLSLFISGRRLQTDICYSIHGNEHCPYLSNGQAIFNYIDSGNGTGRTYACDIDVLTGSIGNLRVVQTNPDIVRFLMKGTDAER